jgi:hypothetical protein
MLTRGLGYSGNVQPLKPVVQRDINDERWQLHKEQVDQRGSELSAS